MDELTARRHGEALLKRMKGVGWTLDVWENVGWHYSVTNGTLTVYASEYALGETTYHSLMGDTHAHAGLPAWTDDFRHKDPNKVVEHQLALAKKYLDKLNRAYRKTVENIHPPKKRGGK